MNTDVFSCGELFREILKEQERVSYSLDKQDIEGFINAIFGAERVFFAGAGRSGLFVRSFAMRCMQMGLKCFCVGDTTTPAIRAGDVLVIGSGSGETGALVQMAKKAKSLGVSVLLVTIFADSSIGRIADRIIRLPGTTFKNDGDSIDTVETVQPGGNLFEQGMFLLFECMSMKLMELMGVSRDELFINHANLE